MYSCAAYLYLFIATLTRNFTSGTYVKFTYDESGKDGSGEIWWGGVPPPSPPPTPTIDCGSCGSTLLNDTTFAHDDVVNFEILPSAAECCAACAKNSKCTQWAWHGVCMYLLTFPCVFGYVTVFHFVMTDRPQRMPFTRCPFLYQSSSRHRRWRFKSYSTAMKESSQTNDPNIDVGTSPRRPCVCSLCSSNNGEKTQQILISLL